MSRSNDLKWSDFKAELCRMFAIIQGLEFVFGRSSLLGCFYSNVVGARRDSFAQTEDLS